MRVLKLNDGLEESHAWLCELPVDRLGVSCEQEKPAERGRRQLHWTTTQRNNGSALARQERGAGTCVALKLALLAAR